MKLNESNNGGDSSPPEINTSTQIEYVASPQQWCVFIVLDAIEEEKTKIPRSHKVYKLKVTKMEIPVRGKVGGSFNGGPIGIKFPVRARMEVRYSSGRSGGGEEERQILISNGNTFRRCGRLRLFLKIAF
ncbi:unnamed protein product [Lactuca saligna]|uniref:Uncharacterized protein n=1 Tax=Lactuca saligna TaxID=75948 RepID=A0AA35VJF0_LACSI|nr:unnamed protein product [Lactuca saligna]